MRSPPGSADDLLRKSSQCRVALPVIGLSVQAMARRSFPPRCSEQQRHGEEGVKLFPRERGYAMEGSGKVDPPESFRRYSAWLGGSLRFPRESPLRANASRNRLWARVDQEIASLVATLKTHGAAELRRLIELPRFSVVREGRLVVTITAHAHVERTGALAVIVEAREPRWAGFAHTLSADGFFLQPDGTIAPMTEEDLWNHGY